MKLRRVLVMVTGTLAVAAALSACGSSSNSSTTGSASASGGSSAQYQARLNLAKCFRAHGINVPDPSANGGIPGGMGRVLQNYSQAQLQAAAQSCKQYIATAFPRLALSPAQQAQFRQQFVKFAQCMRSHGINIPDPSTTAGGGFGLVRPFRSVDRNSPAFQAAAQACQSLRPKIGRGGAVAGGPGA